MKNNDYTDVRIIDGKIYVKVYGIDTIFSRFIELCKIDMVDICNTDNKDNLSVDFYSPDMEETLSLFYSDNKLIAKYIKNNNECLDSLLALKSPYDMIDKLKKSNIDITPYEEIKLKPEVGYEIINKLKELYGDELYEK